MKLAIALSILATLACGKGKDSAPPPPKPASGAPVAFEATKLVPGAAGSSHAGSAELRAYNFSDKTIAQYWVMIRYVDAKGAALKVKAGTPFEADFESPSFAGQSHKCEAKSWCTFKIDTLDIPAGAAKAEVIAKSLTAMKDDIHPEDKPLYDLPGMDWPK